MNRANKSIGWTDWTWNPIKGICPVGCWYCYARKIYKRFDLMGRWAADPYWDRDFSIDKDTIFFDEHEASQPYITRVGAKREIKPRKIFVCSTIEMFHPEIPTKYRDEVFHMIESCPQDTFQVLTKLPENIDREMPNNVWLGVTTDDATNSFDRMKWLHRAKVKTKFVSFEPLLSGHWGFNFNVWLSHIAWAIVGRLTGYGHKYDPNKDDIDIIVKKCKEFGIPIFLKDNLKEIWGEPLIQEFPK